MIEKCFKTSSNLDLALYLCPLKNCFYLSNLSVWHRLCIRKMLIHYSVVMVPINTPTPEGL